MGSSVSVIWNEDRRITIATILTIIYYLRWKNTELNIQFQEAENLKSKNNISQSLLSQERANNSYLNTIVVGLKNKISSLEIDTAASKSECLTKQKLINQLAKDVAQLKTQLTKKQEIITTLNITITEIEIKLKKTDQLNNNFALEKSTSQIKLAAEIKNNNLYYSKIVDLKNKIRSLEEAQISDNKRTIIELNKKTKETEENRKSINILTNKCTELKAQKHDLTRELAQLKKTNQFAIQAALEDLSKRADTISDKILKKVKNNNRENFTTKFQTLKDENDAMIEDLKTVTFTTRLYRSHHDTLLKLQDETDEICMETLKTIHEITKDCKKLNNDYNSVPDSFLTAIAEHTRDMDMLEDVNFCSVFAKEEAVQQEILSGLSQEKCILEGILKVEKCNNNTYKVEAQKSNNLKYVTNPGSNQTYDLVVYNMPEATDDKICFETFMRDVTGRKIDCFSVQRFGILRKSPRPAKITLKSLRDFKDVLHGKASNFEEYGRIRVGKYNPRK